MNSILENIEAIRKEKGLKQMVIAERLGIKQSSYSRYFTDADDMRLSMLLRIFDILGVSLVDIITYPTKYVPENEESHCEACAEKDRTINILKNYIEILESKQRKRKNNETAKN